MQQLKWLESQLKELENTMKHTDLLLKQVSTLIFKINETYNKKVEYDIFRLKSNYYESGEKCGKILAR